MALAAVRTKIAEIQPKIGDAVRAGDCPAASKVVDDAFASSGFEGIEKQRLMVAKLG